MIYLQPGTPYSAGLLRNTVCDRCLDDRWHWSAVTNVEAIFCSDALRIPSFQEWRIAMSCPRCGAKSEPDQRFCKNCGAPLGTADPASSAAVAAAEPVAPAVPPPAPAPQPAAAELHPIPDGEL